MTLFRSTVVGTKTAGDTPKRLFGRISHFDKTTGRYERQSDAPAWLDCKFDGTGRDIQRYMQYEVCYLIVKIA